MEISPLSSACQKRLYGIINGTEVWSIKNVTKYEKKNSHVLMIFCAKINKKILQQLVNCKTTRKMWEKIVLLQT